jgi:hypothetical protein
MTAQLQHEAILERFQHTAPVDVTALAEALGLAVWEDDDLSEGVSGKLFQDKEAGGPEGYSISVRASDPYVRRRFTVAHEIGHFVLHRNRIGSSLTDDGFYRSNLSSWEEVEANQFAARALMPRELLKQHIQAYGIAPALLSTIFKVSESAMRIRIESLKKSPL